MFKKKSTTGDTRLERVFLECRKESEHAYASSLDIFEALLKTLAASKSEIRAGIQAISQLSVNDSSIKNVSETLKSQLRKIETSLEEDADNILNDLRIKRQHDDTFNITLFGRTMVGKSTLMSILTHANEEAIGNGAQRTTRDVREYRWKGMCVTDVPGIDAYGGKEDERVAEMAAKNADLIIFMISSGQPESTEADWLIKLKKEDKAIICLCNFKMGLPILRIKLKNKPALIADMDLSGLKKQFNEFLRTGLPNEHVEIYVSLLLAELMASKPEFKNIREDLHEVSRFAEFTKAVEAQVSSRGVFYRRKSYFALIDAPIYQHYRALMRFTNDTYAGWLNAHKKQLEFQNWQRDFNSHEKEMLCARIRALYNQLKKSVSNFVEDNVEKSNVKDLWEKHCAAYNAETKVKETLEMSCSRCELKIKDLFEDLGKDLNMVNNLSYSFGNITGDGSLTNCQNWPITAALTLIRPSLK